MPKDPLTTGEIILKVGGLGLKMSDGTAVIDGSGNIVAPISDTLTSGKIFLGDSSNVSQQVTLSGDMTVSNTGVTTVAGATSAFNVGTNQTWTKEVNHTDTVTTTTTANTAGGNITRTAGQGLGTGTGGTNNIVGGASGVGGATGNGGNATMTGGTSNATNGNGGSVVLTPGVLAGTGVTGVVYSRGTDMFKMSAPAAKTTDATLTAAEILGGLITVNQGGAGTSTLTLPLGTSLQSALPSDLAVGDCFQFSVINISTVAAEDCIMAGNTGTTYVGKTTINSNDAITSPSSATFVVRCTGVGAGAGTFSIYRVS